MTLDPSTDGRLRQPLPLSLAWQVYRERRRMAQEALESLNALSEHSEAVRRYQANFDRHVASWHEAKMGVKRAIWHQRRYEHRVVKALRLLKSV